MIKSLLLKLSAQYPQYGFQTLFGLLRNMGNLWNHKRVRRIYCELKLNLKRKPKKRLAPRTAVELETPMRRNEVWSIDFMHDALACGRRFRTMNVIDDHRRQCLGILTMSPKCHLFTLRWLYHFFSMASLSTSALRRSSAYIRLSR